MTNTFSDESSLVAKVAAIQKMSTEELMALWPKLFGTDAPKLNKRLLQQRLAFRVQELELGGLSGRHKEQLQRMRKGATKGKPAPKARIHRPPVGTRLTKEYDGDTHEVTVTRDGFEYCGQIYRSLSAIARVISGSHWSGPVFFGLKDDKGEKGREES